MSYEYSHTLYYGDFIGIFRKVLKLSAVKITGFKIVNKNLLIILFKVGRHKNYAYESYIGEVNT